MKKYYFRTNISRQNHAGNKAVQDCQTIMENCGYHGLDLFTSSFRRSIPRKAENFFQLIRLFGIPSGSTIVAQYPIYDSRPYLSIFRVLKQVKRIKLILIIHDLQMLRSGGLIDEHTARVEKDILELSDILISHNCRMSKYLEDNYRVSRERIVNLELFDYLVERCDNNTILQKDSNAIAIAGNLAKNKSGYVYKLHSLQKIEDLSFALYGVNYSPSCADSSFVKYLGEYPANRMPDLIQGKYGLVWDGDSLKSCAGLSGAYLQYNNPHKVSLYIAACIPVIIWRKAALADYIIENELGIAVDSLEDLQSNLLAVDDVRYSKMKDNLDVYAKKVRSGYYLTTALTNAETILQSI